MANPAEIIISIVGKNTSYKKALDEAKRDTTTFGNVVQGIFQGIGQAIFNGTTRVVGAAVSEIGKATRAASDLGETVSKVNTVFGASSKEMLQWSKDADTSFGLSQRAALEATSTMGNMFIQMGEGREQAAGMSALMVELAADLSSFHNVAGGATEVLGDMQSAFRGEFDPIQKYIPLINAATVEQQALAESGKATAKELTALDKALAVQTLIMQGAGVAAGDFARTIGGVANQERILAAQLENARATLGQAFTPIYGEILRGLNMLIGQVAENGEGIVQALATGMVNGIIYLLPVIRTITDFFTYWLRPQSPPRAIPDLAKWGAETINVWLRSMTKADFSILRELGSSIEGILRSYAGTGQIKETDLVGRVFGSQASILRAIDEWRRLGNVSKDALDDIRRSAGPAGDAVGSLVESYFDLERASTNAARAQEELNRVTNYYDRILSPLDSKLRGLQERQEDIRDEQRLTELGRTLQDPNASQSDRRLARLEADEIRLRDRIQGIQEERDTALDAQRKKLDAAEKEQEVAQDKFEREQASLEQHLNINRLLGEQIDLRKRLASEALAEQEKALRELEAAQREAERAQKEAQAEAQRHAQELERLYQAQLAYNLSVADAPGKLALLKLELGRYTESSTEYWSILGQIKALEKEIAEGRDKGAGGAGLLPPVLPDIANLNVPNWASELATKLRTEIDKAFGTQPDFGISIKGGSSILNKIIGPEPEKLPEVSQDVKDFVDTLGALTDAVMGVTGPLETLASLFAPLDEGVDTTTSNLDRHVNQKWVPLWDLFYNHQKQKLEESTTKTGEELDKQDKARILYLGIFDGFIKNGWQGAWNAYLEVQRIALEDGLEDARQWWQWFMDLFPKSDGVEPVDATSPLRGLSDAGSAIINNLWDGIKDAWQGFSEWWAEKMQWISDMIPDLPPWLGGSLQPQSYNGPSLTPGANTPVASLAGIGGSTVTTTNNGGPVTVNLNFTGPVTPETVRRAVGTADEELRRRGFK